MKLVFEIKTEPVTQATIIVVIVTVSSGSLASIAIYSQSTYVHIFCCVILAIVIYTGGAVAEAVPPKRGAGTSLLTNEGGAIMFDLDGLSSRPLDESSTAVASRCPRRLLGH
jgi:hypothetical protein